MGTLTAGQFAIYGDIKKLLGMYKIRPVILIALLTRLGATGGVEIAK